MRDGNILWYCNAGKAEKVFELPMRDGNSSDIKLMVKNTSRFLNFL